MPIINSREKRLSENHYEQLPILMRLLGEIAKDKSITGESLRVLMHLYSKIPIGICREINKEQIGRELGMKGQNVGRAVRALVEKNIIIERENILGGTSFCPNPYCHTSQEINHG